MSQSNDMRTGYLAGFTSYFMWGVFPLYFHALHMVAPDLMLSHRILWSVPTGLALVIISGKMRALITALRDKKTFGFMVMSGALIGANWLTYIWAVHQERVLEASLGYYISPLLNFLLAALLFSERFNRLQLAAIGLAVLGVINQWMVVGVFPVVALILCLSFGIYSVIRKQVLIDSRVGFTLEVLLIAPFAGFWIWRLHQQGVALLPDQTYAATLVVLSGVITAAPLILFGLAAKRLKFSTIGLMQFIGPTLQFLIGLLLGEPFTPGHAVTFLLIWSGVGLFCYALWRRERRDRRERLAAGA